ncbi:MAG TPA: allophanate hydrolase [Polyangiaceae bacterium]
MNFEIQELGPRLARGEVSAADVVAEVYRRIQATGTRPVFVELLPRERTAYFVAAAESRRARGERLPLFGIPFAIKDNIDLAGVPTTAACPAFAYVPGKSAPAVARLVDAGAIPIGKTNLDQFATGLVGTRSPFGACASVFDDRYVSGGSSSGSGVAVARALVSFALGTDTAGSGRVPAAFNNVVGVKPTRGLVSTRGVVPACRSLDCVSVFAGSVPDAELVLETLAAFDPDDPFSRELPPGERGASALASIPALPVQRLGVPRELEGLDPEYERLFGQAVKNAAELGVECVPIDVEPLLEAALLLYGGPWVAERYAAVGEFIASHPDEVHPVVRDIVLGGVAVAGADVFRGRYRLAELVRRAAPALGSVDAVLLPTTPLHPTIDAVLADPVEQNSTLGRFTNFMNLMDLAGVAFPAGFTREGLPFGVTLAGPALSDLGLLRFADALHRALPATIGNTGFALTPPSERPTSVRGAQREVLLAVAGAHLSGLPLNGELTNRGARLLGTARTAAEYRFYALAGTSPAKPGLVRSPGFSGPGIEVELWTLGREAFGSFVAGVPAPMVIGNVTLDDGRVVKSFLCEPYVLEGSEEITAFGGFRAYLAKRSGSG